MLKGVINALGRGDWESEFDLSPAALPKSFLAVALYIPLGFVVANAAVKYNDNTNQAAPYLSIAIILVLISLTFPLLAYILCSVFDKQDRFRPWVIVRNWAILFALLLAAGACGLYIAGLLPFSIAYMTGLTVYLGILAIDVRLAMRIPGFDWIGAVFAGVLVSAASMMVLLMGMTQAVV